MKKALQTKKIPSAALRWVNSAPPIPDASHAEPYIKRIYSWQDTKRHLNKDSPTVRSHQDWYADRAASLVGRVGHK